MRPNEQEIFRGRFLTLTTEDRDGQTFERAYSRNGVTVFCEPAPHVLRFAYGTSWKKIERGPMVVSAYLEDGEDPLECARRELKEELGATASDWTHFLTSEWRGTVIKTQEIFIARGITQGAAAPDADEDITGHIDLSHEKVITELCALSFGTNENAFALFKYITEQSR